MLRRTRRRVPASSCPIPLGFHTLPRRPTGPEGPQELPSLVEIETREREPYSAEGQMMFSLRSPTRAIGLTLICLMVLTQTSCATWQMSPSLAPGPDESGSEREGEGVSDLGDIGGVILVVAAAAAVGYLVYKFVTSDSREAEGESESDPPPPPPACTRLVSPDPGIPRRIEPMKPCVVPTPPSWLMPSAEAKGRPFAFPHLR